MISSLALTVLVENTVNRPGLLAEHGLSILVEVPELPLRLLWDTGQGQVLLHNARQLGISLDDLDAIALSHGHYDHTGGLLSLLSHHPPQRLYLHPDALKPKYSPRGNIGSPLNEAQLQEWGCSILWTSTPTPLAPGIHLTGPIPRQHPLEDAGGQFWQDSTQETPDSLWDDQALFLETQQGIVVILGCAHAGVINTLNYIAQLTGQQTVYGVIGGMHLLNASPERIQATLEALAQYQVQIVGANHCTGIHAIAALQYQGRGIYYPCSVGTHLLLPNLDKLRLFSSCQG
ncbi:MBL fold metallo-hydrolase [Spirulina subsalsa FACHB-351]|uniref:MBL fold metallo-hydrolase n=1 Tax=Spirulina subsalsa FACHB-351 TaxID=234711 RepID=A0ABT3L6F1_9CYAN|nr:MBL fold metallo-hydrolase [Spirulina subsalsa]MCW6037078.1 MBL fold metallo-hydrolase [Spirulina subsalsa FACHB-351]